MKLEFLQEATKINDELIAIRRYLHQHPELSFEEYHTAAYIQQQLDQLQIPYTAGVAGTGIIALIEGQHPTRKCIALRADMDALPIQETNTCEYSSVNEGVMHACGHDVHTTCLLGAVKILHKYRDQFEGTIKVLFQPGEELSPGGASIMIAEGALENPKPESIVGLHVFPDLPAGYVGFRQGEYMASADEIYINIYGKGGHAALPHKTIDPITITAQVITALQQIVSRRSNPLTPSVLTFGKITGGNANNVIPDMVRIEGTFRTFDEVWRAEALELVKKIAINTAEMYGGSATIEIPQGYPSVYNAPALTEKIEACAKEYLGADKVTELDKRMTAEDFSFYTQVIDGCFFRLGTNKNNELFTKPVHTSDFDINEEALATGAGLMAYIAYNLIKQ